jgi:hypothetical protein
MIAQQKGQLFLLALAQHHLHLFSQDRPDEESSNLQTRDNKGKTDPVPRAAVEPST